MIVLTNKCCEILPIDDLSKIKIKGRINTLTYIVDDGKQKYRKNNFNHPRNADKEYPLMIIVDSKFKRLFCCGNDIDKLNFRNELVSNTILLCKDDGYKFIYKAVIKANIMLFFENLKSSIIAWFLKIWYAGILNKRCVITTTPLTLKDNIPDLYMAFTTMDSIMKKAKEVKVKILEAKSDKGFLSTIIRDEA